MRLRTTACGPICSRRGVGTSLAECRISDGSEKRDFQLSAEEPPYHAYGHRFPLRDERSCSLPLAAGSRCTDSAGAIFCYKSDGGFDNREHLAAYGALSRQAADCRDFADFSRAQPSLIETYRDIRLLGIHACGHAAMPKEEPADAVAGPQAPGSRWCTALRARCRGGKRIVVALEGEHDPVYVVEIDDPIGDLRFDIGPT